MFVKCNIKQNKQHMNQFKNTEAYESIKKQYPNMNDLFIQLVMDYCENHTEEEINAMLGDKNKQVTCPQPEPCYFEVE